MGSMDLKLADHPKLEKGKPLAVIVLDGWGEEKADQYNCIHVAETPTMDSLKKNIAPPEAPDLQRKICRVISRIKSVIHLVVALLVRVFTVTLPVRRENDIELLGISQPVVFNEEDRDSNEPDQSTTADFQLHQSTVISNNRSVIQVTVALVFAGGSFGVMSQVPGGVNELGRAVLGDTIGFNVFLVADTLTLFASLAVAMVVATVSHISGKLEYFICINLWAAVVGFVLTFLATEYVVVFPS